VCKHKIINYNNVKLRCVQNKYFAPRESNNVSFFEIVVLLLYIYVLVNLGQGFNGSKVFRNLLPFFVDSALENVFMVSETNLIYLIYLVLFAITVKRAGISLCVFIWCGVNYILGLSYFQVLSFSKLTK
jgi:hypothetical protein